MYVSVLGQIPVVFAIVFSGVPVHGKTRISPDEKAAYLPSIRRDVYWQQCVWVDREVAVQWVKQTFKDVVKGKEEKKFSSSAII